MAFFFNVLLNTKGFIWPFFVWVRHSLSTSYSPCEPGRGVITRVFPPYNNLTKLSGKTSEQFSSIRRLFERRVCLNYDSVYGRGVINPYVISLARITATRKLSQEENSRCGIASCYFYSINSLIISDSDYISV